MRIIAITNLKGGVGKTTTAVNLAAAVARKIDPAGGRVLLVDLDSQVEASATSWLGGEDRGRDFLDVLEGKKELVELVEATDVPGLDLIAGSESLAKAETSLSNEPGAQAVLRSHVRKLRRDEPKRWRLILIDMPPAQGFLMFSGLAAATDVLLTIESGAMSLSSLLGLHRVVQLVRERLNPELVLFGALQTRADVRTRLRREVAELLHKQFPKEAFETFIRTDVKLLEAPGHRQDIFSYAPGCRAAEDYAALAEEVGKRLGLTGFD